MILRNCQILREMSRIARWAKIQHVRITRWKLTHEQANDITYSIADFERLLDGKQIFLGIPIKVLDQ